ncbi:MAG: hypothetical protein EOM19_07395 [Candidatus Moranbacteria bacterium]|nr:hypothetical protein [Candidatus Moranbacteria bacterium]
MEDIIENIRISSSVFFGDLSLFGVILLLFLFLIFVVGRYRIVHFVLNTYIALGFVLILPKEIVTSSSFVSLIVFFAVLSILTLLGEKIFDIHARVSTYSWFSISFLGMTISGFICGIFFRWLPRDVFLWDMFSLRSIGYFSGEWSLIFWFVVPLVFLFILGARR